MLPGTDLTIATSYGGTVLHMAAYRGDPEIVQSMLEHGAPVDCQSTNGNTALHIAIIVRSKSAMLVLLKAGAFAAARYGSSKLFIGRRKPFDQR